MDEYGPENPVAKSGATITYGPFTDVPITADAPFLKSKQKKVAIHYAYDHPVLEITKLKRSAEISHWGANLNIEDKIDLHHAGPRYVTLTVQLSSTAFNKYG